MLYVHVLDASFTCSFNYFKNNDKFPLRKMFLLEFPRSEIDVKNPSR